MKIFAYSSDLLAGLCMDGLSVGNIRNIVTANYPFLQNYFMNQKSVVVMFMITNIWKIYKMIFREDVGWWSQKCMY